MALGTPLQRSPKGGRGQLAPLHLQIWLVAVKVEFATSLVAAISLLLDALELSDLVGADRKRSLACEVGQSAVDVNMYIYICIDA